MLFDGAGAPIDYVFLETNASFERQTGLKDAVGKHMRELAPDHEPYWYEVYGRISRTGVAERFEHGAEALGHWYEVYAFPTGEPGQGQVGVLFNDVSERKQRDELLLRSEERLKSAVEVGCLGLWDWNIATGEVHWSDEHFAMIGYRMGEVVPSHKAWIAHIHPEDREATERALHQAMERAEDYVHEYRVVHPDGSVHWLSGRGRFFYGSGRAWLEGVPVRGLPIAAVQEDSSEDSFIEDR